MVCPCIVSFWTQAGRPETITTDPVTSERGGAPIRFASAVVGCIADPPATLNGETLRADIERVRRVLDMEGWLDDMDAPDREASDGHPILGKLAACLQRRLPRGPCRQRGADGRGYRTR